MHEEFRSQRLSERVGMLRERGHFMEVLPRIGLKYKTSLDLRSGFLIKFYASLLSMMMTWEVNRELKREGVEIHQMRILHVPSMERIILVTAS